LPASSSGTTFETLRCSHHRCRGCRGLLRNAGLPGNGSCVRIGAEDRPVIASRSSRGLRGGSQRTPIKVAISLTAPGHTVLTTVAGPPTLRHRDSRSVVIRIDGRIVA
jgi:hypothetical protein